MYVRDFIIRADAAIVDRFKDGFVHSFGRQSLSVSIPYSLLCESKIKTDEIARLAFVFTDIDASLALWSRPLPTLNLWWKFDFTRYIKLSPKEKQHAILEALHSASTCVADILAWRKEPLNDAYRTLKESSCAYTGLSKKRWISPNKKHRVQVSYSFVLEGVELSAVLFKCRSNEEVERVPLGTFPHCLDWGPSYLGRGQWIDDSDFELELGSFFADKKRVHFSSV